MSFINPEKVPVKVYRSTDQDAPRLDRSPNCVATIFKACLVTGYGKQQGAGWTIPFEDNNNSIKVLRPEVSAEQDFYLRLSNDDGREMTAQVFLNMTDENTGDLKLQCDTTFHYGYGQNSGKWLLIATSRSFWFLFEQVYQNENPDQTGGYFFCGDTAKNPLGNRAVYLQHTGGQWKDGAGFDILSNKAESNKRGITENRILDEIQQVSTANVVSLFNSQTAHTAVNLLAPVYAIANQQYYPLPMVYTCANGASRNNFDAYQDKIVFALSSYASYEQKLGNYYFDTEYAVY